MGARLSIPYCHLGPARPYSESVPFELDEAAKVGGPSLVGLPRGVGGDVGGATPIQIGRKPQ